MDLQQWLNKYFPDEIIDEEKTYELIGILRRAIAEHNQDVRNKKAVQNALIRSPQELLEIVKRAYYHT